MKLQLFKSLTVAELLERVPEHLDVYRHERFENLERDASYYLRVEIEADSIQLRRIACSGSGDREVGNCISMWRALPMLTPYLARDERLWVRLTHIELLDYSRKRWPIPHDDDKAVKHIRTHFFATTSRSFERDNAASRLWWISALCNRVQGIPLEEALECILYRADVRASIIERPTTSQSRPIFNAIVRVLNDSYHGDKSLFERETFRRAMKELNLVGGRKLLDALPDSELIQIVNKCFSRMV